MSNEKIRTILFRVDGDMHIGVGHLMRCFALAEEWVRIGNRAVFLSKNNYDLLRALLSDKLFVQTKLSAEPGSAEDGGETIEIAEREDAIGIVVDGYHLGKEYQKVLFDSKFKFMQLDDNGDICHEYADFILNQNSYACEGLYPNRRKHTQLFLGSDFVLLRSEFSEKREPKEIKGDATKVLLTFGGAPNKEIVTWFLDLLEKLACEPLQIKVVSGVDLSNVHNDSRNRIEWIERSSDMAELMVWCDIAISAAGTTVWELLFQGVPSAVVVVADNQREIARDLASKKVLVSLGTVDVLEVETVLEKIKQLSSDVVFRQTMSLEAQKIIDGKGVNRVLDQFCGEVAK